MPTVGRDWPRRFVERHSDTWQKVKVKFLDMKRKSAHKKEDIEEWYELYSLLCEMDQIEPDNTWNLDETGFPRLPVPTLAIESDLELLEPPRSSSPLRNEPRTMHQFQKATKWIYDQTSDMAPQNREKVIRYLSATKLSLQSGAEAVQQVKSIAKKQLDRAANNDNGLKNWRLKRVGGILTNAAGVNWRDKKDKQELRLRDLRKIRDEKLAEAQKAEMTIEETERAEAEKAFLETDMEETTEEIRRLEYSQALEYAEIK